jgi:hypothetical protein
MNNIQYNNFNLVFNSLELFSFYHHIMCSTVADIHTHTEGVSLSAGPCTVTVNDLLCILLNLKSSAILHFE